VALLTGSLGDRDPAIRRAAAEMLGRFAAKGLPRLARSLGEALPTTAHALGEALHDSEPTVRAAAAKATGHWGSAAERLIALLSLAAEDPNGEVRDAAVRSIGELGRQAPAEAVNALIAILEQASRRPSGMVELVVQQLHQCGPDVAGSAAPALAALLADRRFDLSVRLAAGETLKWLSAEASDVVDRLVDVFTAEASDGDEQVRTVAAAALASTAVAPAEAARHIRNTAQRDRLVEALRRVGPEATELRRGVQAAWKAPPTQVDAAMDGPATARNAGPVPDQPASANPKEPTMAGDVDGSSSDSAVPNDDRLAAVAAEMAEIKKLLHSQQRQPAEKDWYTVREAAELIDYSEWTLRQACNTGRITGEKGRMVNGGSRAR